MTWSEAVWLGEKTAIAVALLFPWSIGVGVLVGWLIGAVRE